MRNFVIVGSHAALHHRIIRKRVPLDYDIIVKNEDGIHRFLDYIQDDIDSFKTTEKGFEIRTQGGKIVEVECGSSCDLKWADHTKYLFSRIREDMLADEVFAPKSWLYFLKMSHRYKKDSPHFYKTMNDIRFMRTLSDCKMPEDSESVFKERERLTYDYGHPKLNVDKDGFFKGDEVPYIYDHDSIHRAVALDGAPAYTNYIKDGEEVLCSKEKFFAATKRIRLLGGLEESLVLTAERSLIPNNFKPHPDRMFKFALSKVCTSITSGWFREYCWEHAPEIMKLYQDECQGVWVDKLLQGIDNGTVLPYTGKTY